MFQRGCPNKQIHPWLFTPISCLKWLLSINFNFCRFPVQCTPTLTVTHALVVRRCYGGSPSVFHWLQFGLTQRFIRSKSKYLCLCSSFSCSLPDSKCCLLKLRLSACGWNSDIFVSITIFVLFIPSPTVMTPPILISCLQAHYILQPQCYRSWLVQHRDRRVRSQTVSSGHQFVLANWSPHTCTRSIWGQCPYIQSYHHFRSSLLL